MVKVHESAPNAGHEGDVGLLDGFYLRGISLPNTPPQQNLCNAAPENRQSPRNIEHTE